MCVSHGGNWLYGYQVLEIVMAETNELQPPLGSSFGSLAFLYL